MRILPFTCFWSCFLCALYAQEPYDQKDLPIGGDMTLALDSFRSLPDGSWGGNMGAYLGLNLAVVIPKQNLGFGAQIGGSYGLYDFDGRGSTNTKSLQQEAFITFGLFRKTPALTGWSSG
ncbi:MAG: hypothetical protein FJZ58_04945, partial [Chlamydiae bacterium]|nr:hypothetical protein [Chlamydiota bacterium]